MQVGWAADCGASFRSALPRCVSSYSLGEGVGVQCFGWRVRVSSPVRRRTGPGLIDRPALLYYLLPKYGGVVRHAVVDLDRHSRRVNNSQNAARETGPLPTCLARVPAGPLHASLALYNRCPMRSLSR